MNQLNIKLLDDTMAFIEANPEKHLQSQWRCGTQQCFAGWACTLDGVEYVRPEAEVPRWKADAAFLTPDEYYSWMSAGSAARLADLKEQNYADQLVPNRDEHVIDPLMSDKQLEISEYAAQALGIDEFSSGVLFSATNSLETLREMVQYLKEEGTLYSGPWDHDGELRDEYEEDYCSDCGSDCSCCCTCDEDENDE